MSNTDQATPVIRVRANANVLGIYIGEVVDMPVNTPELSECIALDLVRVVNGDGSEQEPGPQALGPTPLRRRCCGG